MKKGERTRFHLLEVAANAIAKFGIDRLSTRLIAKSAGTSLGLISHYFPKGSDLFSEVVEYTFIQVQPAVRKADATTEEKIIFAIQQNFELYVERYPHYYQCLLLSYYYIPLKRRLRELHQHWLDQSKVSMEGYIRTFAQEHNVQLPDEKIKSTALAILEQIEGGLIFCSFLKQKEDRKKYVERHVKEQQSRLRQLVKPER